MQQSPAVRLRPATRRAEAHLAGVGAHRPERVVTNDEIARSCDTSDSWIRERTGIATRRFAAAGETVADMAVGAGKQALAQAAVAGSDVDLVLVATSTHAYASPGAAQDVATRIGAHGAGAADVNVGCAGFCYALGLAADAIRAGTSQCAVVAASERLSDFLDLTDRSTSAIFGDGAGAVVLTSAELPTVGPVAWASDGRQRSLIAQSPGWWESVDGGEGRPFVRMDGRAVFRWTTTALTPVALRACGLAGVAPSEIRVFVPHQANLRIIEALVTSLKLQPDIRIARDIIGMGNTSAASIPLAVAALRDAGEVASGDLALCLAFGAGLSIAGQVIQLP